MAHAALGSLGAYSQFIAELLAEAAVERSTVSVWSDSPYTGIAEGERPSPDFVAPGFWHLQTHAPRARSTHILWCASTLASDSRRSSR